MSKLIAVIDDDVELEFFYRLVFESYIEKNMVSFVFFSSSEDFSKWVVTFKPDLVITDMNMPGLSGVEILKLISLECPRAVRYVVSGHSSGVSRERLKLEEVDRFISKPFKSTVLSDYVKLDLKLRDV